MNVRSQLAMSSLPGSSETGVAQNDLTLILAEKCRIQGIRGIVRVAGFRVLADDHNVHVRRETPRAVSHSDRACADFRLRVAHNSQILSRGCGCLAGC